MDRIGVWLAILGLGLALLMWVIPPAWLRQPVKFLLGGGGGYMVVFGLAALTFEWGAGAMSFWPSVIVGGVACGVVGALVVGAAWRLDAQTKKDPPRASIPGGPSMVPSPTTPPDPGKPNTPPQPGTIINAPPTTPRQIHIEQRSEGPDSPNIVTGDHSPVSITYAPPQRRLNERQIMQLRDILAARPEVITTFMSVANDGEAKTFLDQVRGVFVSAGWQANGIGMFVGSASGLTIGASKRQEDQELARFLFEAFKSAGVDATLWGAPRGVDIIVGTRPSS